MLHLRALICMTNVMYSSSMSVFLSLCQHGLSTSMTHDGINDSGIVISRSVTSEREMYSFRLAGFSSIHWCVPRKPMSFSHSDTFVFQDNE